VKQVANIADIQPLSAALDIDWPRQIVAQRSNVALRSVKLPCFNRGVIQVDQGHLPLLPVLAIKKKGLISHPGRREQVYFIVFYRFGIHNI